jgi:hypothetical protein
MKTARKLKILGYFILFQIGWVTVTNIDGVAQSLHLIHVSVSETACVSWVGQQGVNSPQIASPLGPAQVGTVSPDVTLAGLRREEFEIVRSRPYQAQAVILIKQTLADGSHIVQTTTADVARDRWGRTVRTQKVGEVGLLTSTSGGSQEGNQVLTTIVDPVAKTQIHYDSATKIAHVITMPASGEAIFVAAVGFFSSPSCGVHATSDDSIDSAGNGLVCQIHRSINAQEKESTESLGTKTIDGLPAVGIRSTTTIPKSTIGNDKDIVIAKETWYSPEFKLVLLSVLDDPCFGQTTYLLANLNRFEPDRKLFQMPAGYKIDKVRARGRSAPEQ